MWQNRGVSKVYQTTGSPDDFCILNILALLLQARLDIMSQSHIENVPDSLQLTIGQECAAPKLVVAVTYQIKMSA